MVHQITAEITYGTYPSGADQSELLKDAGKLAHWSYLVTQAISNGTSQATVQLPDDLGEAGLAVTAAAFPPSQGEPDPQAALNAIIAVGQDCADLGITGG